MRQLAFVGAFSLSLLTAQEQVPHRLDSSNLVIQLLAVPRRGEANGHSYWDDVHHFVRPQREPQRPPGPNASLRVLADYWERKPAQDPDRLPNALRARLLDACEAYPDAAANLVHLVPLTTEANKRLLALANRLPNDERESVDRQQILRHLSRHSNLFRADLFARAESAREREGFVENEADVRALARLDWDRAAPLIGCMVRENAPRMTALALTLQYRHAFELSLAEAAGLRSQLMKIAANQSMPAKARDLAIEELMSTEWSERDSWFESLFADASLAGAVDGQFSFGPLEGPVRSTPSRWIPRVATLTGSPNPAIRQNASYILVGILGEENRPDAAVPLLPWLFDPNWTIARDSGHDRHILIYSLSQMRLPESVRGLLHVLSHPEQADNFEIEYAADAVSQYHDKSTASLMRWLLAREGGKDERLAVAKALLASGEVSIQEKVWGVVAFARQIGTRAGREHLHQIEMLEPLTVEAEVVLGRAVVEIEGDQRSLTEAMRAWSTGVRNKDREAASWVDALLAILPDRDRDARLLSGIRDGSVSVSALLCAIERREWLQKTVSGELAALAMAEGAPGAIAATLLGDSTRQREILSGDDISAQSVLLALLRLSGATAPDELVERLVASPDPVLAQAARAYWDNLSSVRHSLCGVIAY